MADKIRVRELGCLLVDRQCNNGGNPSIECGPRGGNHVFPRRASRFGIHPAYGQILAPHDAVIDHVQPALAVFLRPGYPAKDDTEAERRVEELQHFQISVHDCGVGDLTAAERLQEYFRANPAGVSHGDSEKHRFLRPLNSKKSPMTDGR